MTPYRFVSFDLRCLPSGSSHHTLHPSLSWALDCRTAKVCQDDAMAGLWTDSTQNVLRLDVPMRYTFRMEVGDGADDLSNGPSSLELREAATSHDQGVKITSSRELSKGVSKPYN